MKKRFTSFLALFIALFVSMQSFAQGEQRTLMLGDYETPNKEQAWDGFNLQNAPFIFTYVHGGSQVMYTADQLAEMKGGEITSLSFKCFTYDDYTNYRGIATLYLQEVEGNEFPKAADGSLQWVQFDKNKVIAETSLDIDFLEAASNEKDVEITFDFKDKPYKYTGKSLVVVIANTAAGDFPQGAVQFYWIPSQKDDPWRSLVYGDDYTDFVSNQQTDLTVNGNEDKWKNAPIAKFTYIASEAPEPTPEGGSLKLGHYDDQSTSAAWDGFNLQNAPVIFTYAHSGSQVIYTPDQLADMKNSKITSMSFKCFPEDCYIENYTSTMKMYLQEIDDTQFPYDEVSEQYSWIEFDENNVIAETEFTMNPLDAYNNGTDIEVKFDLSKNPYVYTGKTLVVTIVNDSEQSIDGSDGTIRFYWIDSKKKDPWKSFVFASDNITFFENQAKDNVLKALDNEDKWKNAPAVHFTYEAVPVAPDFSGGEGTEANPYLISKVEDLAQMDVWTNEGKTKGVYFKLTQDITETPFTGVIGSEANFKGFFDGDNHIIDVDINYPDMTWVGLFGCVEGGSVKNLQVTGNIVGSTYVGALGQAANNTVVENVVNYSNVTGKMFAAGVIGSVITQEPSAGCKISQLANYGTINGNYSGGVIGDCGQQVGNNIKRLANYGHINGNKKSGGLIANARFYDEVYYGINLGTTENTEPAGCLGNTISSTIGDLYYDSQLFYSSNEKGIGEAGNTIDFLGSNFKSNEAGNGFSEEYWLYADNMYPRLKINGIENSTIAILYATPIILAEGDNVTKITKAFTVSTENGVKWTSQNGSISFDGATATPINAGEDIITATLNGVTRNIKVVVDTIPTGINEIETSAVNSVKTVNGAVIITLVDNANVQIMGVSGSSVMNAKLSAGIHTYSLHSGMYIIRINNNTYKVCVK